MIEYYSSHPLYILLIAALLILTVFVCIKAGKASSRHSKQNSEIIKKLKEENSLRNEFSILTENLILSSESERLFKGVGLCLQKTVSDSENMQQTFDAFTDGQKYIYSMYCLFEDANEKLSNFFHLNTSPLIDTAKNAVDAIMPDDFKVIFNNEFDSYDENNENASVIPDLIDELDKKAAPFFENGTVEKLSGEYIKNNISLFIQ